MPGGRVAPAQTTSTGHWINPAVSFPLRAKLHGAAAPEAPSPASLRESLAESSWRLEQVHEPTLPDVWSRTADFKALRTHWF